MSILTRNAPEFIATYWTLAGNVVPLGPPAQEASPHEFTDRVAVAAALGYRGMGLIFSDLVRTRDRIGYSNMRKLLESHRLSLELEFLLGWHANGEELVAAEASFAEMLIAAAELGARHIKVGADMQAKHWPLNHMCERFAQLCRRAASSGAGIVLEPMPWSNVADLATARALIEGAGETNGGLLIDIWHMARGGISYDEVASLPPGIIHHVELDDAEQEVRGTLIEDTLNHRRFCGAGALDVPAFIRALNTQGYRGPYGIEILAAEQRQRPYQDVARDAIETARAQFEVVNG